MKITELPQPLQELARKYQRESNSYDKNTIFLSSAFYWYGTKEGLEFWEALDGYDTIEEARISLSEEDRAKLDRILNTPKQETLFFLSPLNNKFPVKTDDYFTFDNRGNKVIRKWENTDECLLLWKKHCSKWLCEGEFQTIKCELVKDGENDVLKKEI